MLRTSHDPVFFWDRYKPDRDGPAPPPEVTAFEWTQCEGHGPGAELLGRPRTALELGAAECREASWLARRGVRVTALDLSPVQVERARRWWKDVPALTIEEGEACSFLRGDDQTYDAVYSIWGAVWFTAPDELFPLVAKRLSPGGVFTFSHGETPQHLTGRQPMYGKGPEGREMTVDRWCHPPETWADIAHKHGFVDVEARCLPAPTGQALGTIIVEARLPEQAVDATSGPRG
ncbi:class I SAM-dependent methyltransferase [Streptomyces sp. TRM75561]|uniref:class I SAM-dependent methyltransferase n=1 Tax=Streptomyces sp. TRM75561 TaxID=2975269 RepID=UPI0024489612|nr:class I SAM-dependent methyltransferase [Streptomyces sp. TRM75561]MDH3038545.1 class I SAM-dependent methyltransferase [Streptomyces sp. TRM75561]